MFYINSYIKVIIRHICLNVKCAFEIQPTQNQLEMFWLRFQSQRQSSWQQQWTEGKSYNSFFWDSGHGSLASSTWENQEVQDHLHGKSFTSHSRQITKWREGPRTRNPFQRHFPSDLIPPARLHLLQLSSLSKLCLQLESMCSMLEAAGQFHIQTIGETFWAQNRFSSHRFSISNLKIWTP